MNIDIKTIAQKSGFSVATVSRVLNNSTKVKKETREKVLKIIVDHNYELNAVARSLRRNKTKTIGIIVGNILSEFFTIVSKSVEDIANKFGYNVIFCNSDYDIEKELRYLITLKSSRVDGIILYPTGGNKDYIKSLLDNGMKIVMIDGMIEGIECDAVLSNNEKGAYLGAKFLIDRGYKKIGFISGDVLKYAGKKRLEGSIKALKESNMKINQNLIKYGDFKKTSGRALMKEFFSSENPDKPDAVFIENLDMAMGAMIALKELGLEVPRDIGVIGFDDSDWAKLLNPPLTTIGQDVFRIGSIACEKLMHNIENINDGKQTKIEVIFLDTILNIRSSTR